MPSRAEADGPVSARPRIVVAGFQHETNTFAPLATSYEDFVDGGGWPGMTFGADVVDVFRDLNIPLGGFLTAAADQADIVPLLWTNAEPASFVSRDAFERICAHILDGVAGAGNVDGIYLDLHGAMVAEDHPDGEGELLRRLRAQVGPILPIAVSLDLHANLTSAMVAHSDAITIYRTYPHLDMDGTGARAWPLLREIIRTGEKPAKAFRQGSCVIPLSAQCTDFGPVGALYDGLSEQPSGDHRSADIALGFPLSDIADAGPAVVVYAADQGSADRYADLLLQRLDGVTAGLENPIVPPAQAVALAADLTRDGGTVVLADVQDNSGAGAMSDTTGLLAALLDGGVDRCVIGALWDPASVRKAHSAGQGARVTVDLGGRYGPVGVVSLSVSAVVEALSDGRFVCTGAMQRDVVTDIGLSALLRVEDGPGSVAILVCSHRHQCIDQEVFRHLGIEPGHQRIVAVKSTVHYRADFAPIAKEIIAVEAPGYSTCRLGALDYRNLRPGVRLLD